MTYQMNLKRKIIASGLTLIGLSVVAFSVLTALGFFKKQVAGILIDTEPVSTVYINNSEVGRTPYEADMMPGEIVIRIKPDAPDGWIIDDYETKVVLVSGIRTIIKRIFNQTEDFSSGALVSFEKIANKEAVVAVVSIPDSAQIVIDSKLYGYAPIRIDVPPGDHNLVIQADGYVAKQLPIKVYKGYKLTAAVKLAKIEKPEATSGAAASEFVSSGFRIRINEVDGGFLQVRSGAGIEFPEILRVNPGEEYQVLEEGENSGWYKIELPDIEGQPVGRHGWGRAKIVTKI